MFCWYYFFLQALLLFLSTIQHITLSFHKALVLPPATPISKHKLDIPGRTHSAVWLFASCYCKHLIVPILSRIFFNPVHRFPILHVWSLKKFLNITITHKYIILHFRPQLESQNRKTGNN